MRIWVAALSAWLGALPALAATQPPQVCQRIPAQAAFVLWLDRPAEAVRSGGGLLERFKGLHPDLDLARLGAKIQAELGENLLTPEGMQAFGIDPAGTIALFAVQPKDEPTVVFPLLDAERFVGRLHALHQRDAKEAAPAPKPISKGGAKLYRFGSVQLAVQGGWGLLLPPAGRVATDPIQAFFGAGRKLAGHRPFVRALGELPAGQHLIGYLAVANLSKAFDADLAEQIRTAAAQLKKAPEQSRKWQQEKLVGLKDVRKRTRAWIDQFEALAGGLEFGQQALSATLIAVTSQAGNKALAKVLPSGVAAPTFHPALLGQALAGGWSGVSFSALVDWVSDLPVQPWRLLRTELEQAKAEFGRSTRLDLYVDVFDNLRAPLVAYFLVPDLSGLNEADPAEAQFLSLVRLLVMTRVADPARASRLLARLDELLREDQQPFETVTTAGLDGRLVRPRPGLEFAWGIKGELVYFGFGRGAADPLAGLQPGGAFPAASGNPLRGQASLDFAALGESMASAVSKGIGGRSGVQFRMAWPLFQQAFARFSKFSLQGELQPVGLIVRAAVGLR